MVKVLENRRTGLRQGPTRWIDLPAKTNGHCGQAIKTPLVEFG